MKQYVVDAFTDSVFHGDQAAVCVLEQWPDEALMMNIFMAGKAVLYSVDGKRKLWRRIESRLFL